MPNNENTLVRSIEKLSYPFLVDLQDADEQTRHLYITEINEVAKASYTKPGHEAPTMAYGQLFEIVKLDPSAWLVCREKYSIQGYIHVQLISNTQAEQLANGKIEENTLIPLSIDSLGNKVIHIGSVASRNFPNKMSCKVPVRLIAGTIDKVVSLRQRVPSVKRIITCDFEDKNGIRHFEDKLPQYGFIEIGKTVGGDTVWELDLEKGNRPFSFLMAVVIAKKISFYEKKQYLPVIKSFLSNLPDTLKKLNQTIDETKKLTKNVSLGNSE